MFRLALFNSREMLFIKDNLNHTSATDTSTVKIDRKRGLGVLGRIQTQSMTVAKPQSHPGRDLYPLISACHMPLGLNEKPAYSWALTANSLTRLQHTERMCFQQEDSGNDAEQKSIPPADAK